MTLPLDPVARVPAAGLDSLVSAVADRYRVTRELGSGGMATVYLARDLRHDRDVALKVLRDDVSRSLGAERFQREIQLAARLAHPHILPLFDSGSAAGALYYVMPVVRGESLRERLAREGRLPIAEAVRLAGEVAGALDYAHRHGIVHRDVKPENVLLQDGHAVVADFGIGKAIGDAGEETMTRAGVSLGTPAYMSPEQAAGDEVDGRSDLYALGCVLYECLAGEPPFTGPTVQAVIAKRFVQVPADVSALREGVPRAVARAVQRALARVPIDRYETCAQFASALVDPDPRPSAWDAEAPARSIAVLPFDSMSAEADDAYLADGIAEEILNALSHVPELRVAGRTSSFSFRGKSSDLRAIGDALRVRTVLEGSVRRAGRRVRVTAQLVDVRDGFRLWSERYDREIEDIFALQDEIARAIAEKLQATMLADGAQAQRAPASVEAYELYLKGRRFLEKRGIAVREGLACMQRASELDPTYALAWSGMADMLLTAAYWGQVPQAAVTPRIEEAVARARAHGGGLAEAYGTHALRCLVLTSDWAGAHEAFERAAAVNPAYQPLSSWRYFLYEGAICQRWDRARAGIDALHERDPLSPFLTAVRAMIVASCDPGDEAVTLARRAVALDGTALLAHWVLGLACYGVRDWAGMTQAYEDALAVSGRNLIALTMLGAGLAERGDVDGARALCAELEARARRDYIPHTALAYLRAALGDVDAAERDMRAGLAAGESGLVMSYSNLAWPNVRALHGLAGYREAQAAMGIPAWRARQR